ncbi:MAG: DUF3488 domain-containing protein, partial [Candidatus Saccharibacteria bacterium]|nr:DUF3488 domain-containing protein [Rhodoferax sp.]
LGAVWTLWDRHQQDPWLRLLHQAQKRLTRAGIAVPANAPPRQMLALLGQGEASTHPTLAAWLLRLEAWRYAPPNTAPDTLRQLQRSFRQLSWPEKPSR